MNIIDKMFFSWYAYYDSGSKKNIAYESALSVIAVPIMIFSAGLYRILMSEVFGLDDILKDKSRSFLYFYFGIFVIISYIFAYLLSPKKELAKTEAKKISNKGLYRFLSVLIISISMGVFYVM